MAGKPGRSGGAREGAGDKPDPPVTNGAESLQTDDPVAFLRALMRDPNVDIKLRQDSAKRLLEHERRTAGDTGKKGQQKKAAEDIAAAGRFAPLAPPKLHAVK